MVVFYVKRSKTLYGTDIHTKLITRILKKEIAFIHFYSHLIIQDKYNFQHEYKVESFKFTKWNDKMTLDINKQRTGFGLRPHQQMNELINVTEKIYINSHSHSLTYTFIQSLCGLHRFLFLFALLLYSVRSVQDRGKNSPLLMRGHQLCRITDHPRRPSETNYTYEYKTYFIYFKCISKES